jgi:hypothetical protein
MTSLLSKLFRITTPRARRSTNRARLGVERLDARIMPMTMLEVRAMIPPPVVPPPVGTPFAVVAPTGGKMAEVFFGKGADSVDGGVKVAEAR